MRIPHQLIDWEALSRKLKGLYRREESHGGGPEPYAPLSMFKLMLLGQWHGLSDIQLEQALKVRIDFMVFTGFEPAAGEFPDASTICRFRYRLVAAKLDQVLLRSINSQLEHRGLKVQGSRGAILDATIIPSAARPNSYIDMEGEEPQIVTSADREARWVKKGNNAFYGYRGYGTVDTEDGYVEHIEVHPTNEAEVNKLPHVIDAMTAANGIAPDGVLADKGYASKANRHYLKDRGMADLIQHKAAKGKPLSPILKKLNTAIGGLRFKVEQAFGTMKRKFHLARARYFGTVKVQAQMCWAALGMNLLKAHRKLQRQQTPMPEGTGAPA
jgi:IS5 family transposase